MAKGEEELISGRTLMVLVYSALFILLFTVVGCLLLPNIFWKRFVLKYLWGPVLADAGVPGTGAVPGYNVISTLLYAYVLILSLLMIHHALIRLGIMLNREFFLSLSPLIISGPLLRTLEDGGFFSPPASFLFISPIIYVYLGLGALLSIWVGVRWDRKGKACSLMIALPPLLTPGTLLFFSLKGLTLSSSLPYVALLLLPLALTPVFMKKCEGNRLLPLKLFSILTFISAILPYLLLPATSWPHPPEYHPLPVIASLGGSIISLWIYLRITRHLSKLGSTHHPSPSGINGAIVFGHTMDAIATSWAVEFLSYSEKHVLPRFLFSLSGTAFSMIPVKIMVVVLVLYTLDVYLKEEARRNPTLFGLLKLAILILGIGPGLRDITRVAVGI